MVRNVFIPNVHNKEDAETFLPSIKLRINDDQIIWRRNGWNLWLLATSNLKGSTPPLIPTTTHFIPLLHPCQESQKVILIFYNTKLCVTYNQIFLNFYLKQPNFFVPLIKLNIIKHLFRVILKCNPDLI